MYSKLESQQLVSNAQYGLSRVYQLLFQSGLKGISQDDLLNSSKLTSLDIPFAQLLYQDFKTTDANNDKVLSKDELEKIFASINSSGMTYQQLIALSSQSSPGTDGNSTLLETILAHFNEIDVNKDGKVSKQEIDAYNINKEVDEKKAEFSKYKASNLSYFVDDETETDSDIS